MSEFFNFPNGLRLVYSKNESIRSVSIGVYVGAGVCVENEQNNGISHFIEHMLFKGTKKRTAFDIVSEVDSIGAKINAATSKQYTYFYTISLDEDFEKCLEILSDLFFNSIFPQKELDLERNVVFEEIAESEDTPDDVCLERATSYSYKGHPFAMQILGKAETLKKLTRQDLYDYMDRFYTADNTVISIVGNVDFDFAKDLVDKYFAKLFKNTHKEKVENLLFPMNKGEIKVSKKIEQIHTVLAFEGFSYDDDSHHYALVLLNEAFASGMSSRLFQRVREKMGLCYTVYGFHSLYKGVKSRYYLYTSTKSEKAGKAIEAIKGEIKLLLKDGLTSEELKKVKKQVLTGLVLGQESSNAVMRAYGKRAILDNVLFDIDEEMRNYEKVTLDDVNETAKLVFNLDNMVLSQVGDFEKAK